MKKLIISSTDLRKVLTKLSQVVNPKHILPAATNIYCKASEGKIELLGTDTEITIIFYSIKCECKETFDFLLPFEFINKIVAIYKDAPLQFTITKSVKIECYEDVYEITPGSKVKEFPALQQFPIENIFTINNDVLKTLHTAIATTGNQKPATEFVCLDLEPNKLTVASTDGSYVGFKQEFNNEQQSKGQLLLSQKVIKALHGSTEAKASFTDKIIGFDNGQMQIIIVRTEYKYPNYNSLLSLETTPNLFVDRFALIDALNKCLLSSDPFKTTSLNLTQKGIIKIGVKDEMLNIDLTVEANNNVEEIENVKIFAEKLLKLLNQIEVVEMQFTITDKNKTIFLTTAELPTYKALIMPIFQK